MTDISREAVERIVNGLGVDAVEVFADAQDMLRALLTRVEELEAVQTGRTSFYEYDKRRLERGRLQGLDEAKEVFQGVKWVSPLKAQQILEALKEVSHD